MMKNSPCDVSSSSYMLIEASGDSEADWNPFAMGEHAYEIGRADDDAQSCIYDDSETCNAADELNGQEFVDEMEKNRLFWEACLAS